jgi:hypothetical protein
MQLRIIKHTQEAIVAELKTKVNNSSVDKFLDKIADETTRADCYKLVALMQQATKAPAKMWGNSIVGFGSYHYTYASGREGDWPLTGFSPRQQNLTLYIMSGFDQYAALMKKLGKYTTGKSCLYIKRLDDVHLPTLKKLIKQSVAHMRKTNR